LGHQAVGFGRQQRVEELIDRLRGLRAHELGDHFTVAKRLHRRDALDPKRPGDGGVGVDVQLDQLHLARASGGGTLEHRPQLTAGSAPLGPEVDHHRQLAGALDDR
jgi:hypothetical protein